MSSSTAPAIPFSNGSLPNAAPSPPPAGRMYYMRVLGCAAGIISSLLLYAVLQERIMARPYSNDPVERAEERGEYFKNTLTLVFANRLAAAAAAALVLVLRRQWADLRNSAPIYTYFMISVSNVLATSCQYEALKWITFPTQTLAKCAKMIPVMIWGTMISRKRYRLVDYVVGVAIMLGCTIFLVSGNIKAKKAAQEDSWIGLVLMLGYLCFDGFTSTFQEKLFKGYSMTIYNQMLYVNLCSSLMSFLFLITSGTLMSSLTFVTTYPQILRDMTLLSISAVSGQFAITYTIKEFGALVYATIMTIRQFLSVFISNMLFRHGMRALQWLGALLVFGALFYKSYAKASTPKAGPKNEPPLQVVEASSSAAPGTSTKASS